MANPFLTISSLEHMGVEDPVGGRFEIYHLCYYFPKRLGDLHLEADTVRILELKNDAAIGVSHYARKVQTALGRALNGARLIAVPSSKMGSAPARYALRAMFGMLPGIEDMSDCLIRHTAIKSSHRRYASERADVAEHVASMRAEQCARIRYQHLLLVDDVVTSGSTMQAARHCLLQAGAHSVTCLALARTMKHDPRPPRSSSPSNRVLLG